MIADLKAGLHHAACVDFSGKGVLITGPAGSGKSTLAMACLGLGAKLVSDDQVLLSENNENVQATCPESINGLMEVRGVGILNIEAIELSNVQLLVDLSQKEQKRLPKPKKTRVLTKYLPLILGKDVPNLALVVYHFLYGGLYTGAAP